MTEAKRFAFARPIELLKLLRQSDDRNLAQAQLGELCTSSIELALATIDQYQVRQSRRAGIRLPGGFLRTGNERPKFINDRLPSFFVFSRRFALLLVQQTRVATANGFCH